jgi:hypothetical protein
MLFCHQALIPEIPKLRAFSRKITAYLKSMQEPDFEHSSEVDEYRQSSQACMHLVVLIETHAQDTLGTNWEVASQRVRLVVEGIARLHTHAQLVLSRGNLHGL